MNPMNQDGDFDWLSASLYWRFLYWLDGFTGWFDLHPEKDE